MCGVLIRSNITCPDLVRYFSSQWSDHSVSQAMGLMTDMKLVGKEGDSWGSVEVHRAVILPLCPLLTIMEKDVTKEDPTVVLEYPLELLSAFVKMIYNGSAPTSAVVNIISMMELMASLGLNMPMDRLMIVMEEVSEIEIIGFKKRIGLEIIDVNGNLPPSSHVHSDRRSSLEIIPSSSGVKTDAVGPPTKCRRLTRAAQTPVSTKKLRLKQDKDSDQKQPDQDVSRLGQDGNVEDLSYLTVDIKIESEEIAVGEVQPTASRKRKYTRRRETLEVPAHACEFCAFKCRFLKDIHEHCDLVHSDAKFACDKCDYTANSFTGLTVHNKKRHVGKGDIVCATCGFRAKKKRQMEWHKRNVHEKESIFAAEVIDVSKVKSNLVDHMDMGEQTGKNNGEEVPVDEDGTPKLLLDLEKYGEGFLKLPTTDDIDNCKTMDHYVTETKITEATDFTNIQDQRKVFGGTEPNVGEHFISDDTAVENSKSDKLIDEVNIVADVGEDNSIDEAKKTIYENSGEVVGFKCSGTGCSRVFRVKFTNPTYVLNRLRAHFAKVHSGGEESEIMYTTLYKEEVKVIPPLSVSNDAEENPLQILKKVKATHKKASSAKKSKNV